MSSRFGTSGQPTRSRVNAFELNWSKNSQVVHYDVLTPSWSNRNGRPVSIGIEKGVEIMRRLQVNVAPDQFPRLGAFDGKKNLFSFVDYHITEQEYQVPWDSSPPRSQRTPMKEVLVRIVYVRTVNVNLLNRLKAGKDSIASLAADSDTSSALNMLNLFVQAQPKVSGNLHKGKSVYVPPTGSSPRGGNSSMPPLKLWHGYFQSVRPTFGKIIVNIDATVGVVMPDQPLEHAFMGHLQTRDARQLRRVSENKLRDLRHFFKSIKVSITLPSHRGRRARPIKDVSSDVGRIEFESDGQATSVAQHFRRAYNITIPDGALGIKIGSHEWFPASVCQVAQQLYKARLTPDQVRQVLAFTAPNPQTRIERITAGWQNLGHNASEFLRGAGIEIDKSPMAVEARILDPPQIGYGNSMAVTLPRDRPGSWDVMNKKLVTPATVRCMLVVNFTGGYATRVMYDFVQDLIEAMHERGMRVEGQADMQNLTGQAEIEKILYETVERTNADFILAILPENAGELYTRVKRFGDIIKGVATQCVRWSRKKIWENYSKRSINQYHNNLILKINARLGGVNHVPISPGMNYLGQKPTMIIGADVSHPGPGSTNPSIASVVASWDRGACQYCALIKLQHSRLEIIQDIREMINTLITTFRSKNKGILPLRIFFFRDGVSEGEFETVRQQELKELQEELAMIYKQANASHPPKVTFIIVGKRHHFRFFPDSKLDNRLADRKTGNCPSGFVVDKDITHPVYFDFYLQSQPGLKGTSIPGHYTVLHDENMEYHPDRLQQLTYSLCHCYSRATKSVKIPAPVYYADLVCRRAKFHYHPDVNYSDDMSTVSAESSHFDFFVNHFSPVSQGISRKMYFV